MAKLEAVEEPAKQQHETNKKIRQKNHGSTKLFVGNLNKTTIERYETQTFSYHAYSFGRGRPQLSRTRNRNTATAAWHLIPGVGNESIISARNVAAAAAASATAEPTNCAGSPISAGDRIVGVGIEPFSDMGRHDASNARNEHTAIEGDKRLGLLAVVNVLGIRRHVAS
ncbi:hypothetical protein RJ639_027694 [Escallonia herrerae]|uniref:Uncharacterized protein n=1 Tax=Escallonia herrerae TaxID=1293975 RepID=A0AA88XC62_9ASTE|nr:hypothetical protein RJ639_025829 [Escallonia herrerae]KAK3039550.1 hypothetical protein RJ639_027694 [Escallonia herrerae]